MKRSSSEITEVTLVYGDKKIRKRKPFFDINFCKNKNKCTLKYASQDCDGKCEDKNLFPKRHRKECKNGIDCIYYPCNSSEFLHTGNLLEEYKEYELDTLKMICHGHGVRLGDIERQLQVLDKIDTESAISITNLEDKFFWRTKKQELKKRNLKEIHGCNKSKYETKN